MRALAILVSTLLAVACGSTWSELRPEGEIPDLARLAKVARERQGERGLTVVGEVAGQPVRAAWRETRAERSEWLVVLIHGVLSDKTTWRFVAGDLGRDHDLLMLDLPGCGGSDKPDPGDVEEGFYTPTGQARAVYRLLRERLAARGGGARVALVGHSYRALVILRMLGDAGLHEEFADVRGRVDSAVLVSPLDFALSGKQVELEAIAGLGALEVTLGSVTGLLREETAKAARSGVDDPGRAVREDAERMAAILEDGDRRRAAQEMIRRAVPFTKEERPDWPRIEALVRDYAGVAVPCLILAGARDELLPVAMSYRLQALLPDAWLYVLAGATHSLQAEHPERCSAKIRRFLETGGAGAPRIVDESADFRGVPGRSPGRRGGSEITFSAR